LATYFEWSVSSPFTSSDPSITDAVATFLAATYRSNCERVSVLRLEPPPSMEVARASTRRPRMT
jgi:hypothetical protein